MVWELLDKPGSEPRKFSLDGEAAVRLLGDAVAGAKAKALPWPEEPIVLKPSEELVELVRLSQLEAVKQTGAEARRVRPPHPVPQHIRPPVGARRARAARVPAASGAR